MRLRVTLAFALVPLAACTLLTGVDSLEAVGDGADASSNRDVSSPVHDAAGASDAIALADAAAEAEAGTPIDASIPDAPLDADATTMLVETCVDSPLVGGNDEVDSQEDQLTDRSVDTYGYKVTTSGTAKCVWIYINSLSPSGVHLGVYTDDGTKPGKLAAKAAIAAPKLGWNSAKLNVPVAVTADQTFWLGVTPLKGTVGIRNHGNDACGVLHLVSASGPETDVPDPYPSMPDQYPTYCDALFYLSATKLTSPVQ